MIKPIFVFFKLAKTSGSYPPWEKQHAPAARLPRITACRKDGHFEDFVLT
jgi:hypothetical protein